MSQQRLSDEASESTETSHIIETHLPHELHKLYEELKFSGFNFTLRWKESDQSKSYNHICEDNKDISTEDLANVLLPFEQTTQENFIRFIDEAIARHGIGSICKKISLECYASRDKMKVTYISIKRPEHVDDDSEYAHMFSDLHQKQPNIGSMILVIDDDDVFSLGSGDDDEDG